MLTATTSDAATDLSTPFVMDDRKYGVVSFWFYEAGPEPTPPQFSFYVSDEPPQFQ